MHHSALHKLRRDFLFAMCEAWRELSHAATTTGFAARLAFCCTLAALGHAAPNCVQDASAVIFSCLLSRAILAPLFPKLRKNVHKKYHPNDYSNQKGGVLTKLAGDNLHLFKDHKGVTVACSVLNFVIIIFNFLFRRGYKK